MELTPEQVLAFRIAAQGLHRDTAAAGRVGALGLQDTGSSAALALAARVPDPAVVPALLAATTAVWTHRGAPHRHPPADLARWAAALRPRDDDDAAARIGWGARERATVGMPALAALDRSAAELAAVVDRPMTKGEASAAVTRRLPPGLWRECAACGTTHVNEQLMRLAGGLAGVELDTGSRVLTLRPPAAGWVPPVAPDVAHLVDRVLAVLGPGTPAEVAGFAGTSTASLRAVWPAVVAELGLVEVSRLGVRAWIRAADATAAADPPPPPPVRLLPPSDPLLQLRDRELLVPEREHRAELFRALGNPGAVLAGTAVVGTWRPRAAGRRLTLTVRAFGTWTRAVRAGVEEEAQRVASARGLHLAGITES